MNSLSDHQAFIKGQSKRLATRKAKLLLSFMESGPDHTILKKGECVEPSVPVKSGQKGGPRQSHCSGVSLFCVECPDELHLFRISFWSDFIFLVLRLQRTHRGEMRHSLMDDGERLYREGVCYRDGLEQGVLLNRTNAARYLLEAGKLGHPGAAWMALLAKGIVTGFEEDHVEADSGRQKLSVLMCALSTREGPCLAIRTPIIPLGSSSRRVSPWNWTIHSLSTTIPLRLT